MKTPRLLWIVLCLSGLAGVKSPAADPKPSAAVAAALPEIERLFADYQIDARLPGVVYGIVAGGRLQHLTARGVQDLETRAPVTADSVFRIASMTKAFTALGILGLRDEGKLRLDDPAELHVPGMRGWPRATADSPPVTVRDLVHHTAGFVTDDPWADRQEDMREEDFSALIAGGVPFTRATGTQFEYSNLGYALLGRIIANAAGRPYAEHLRATLLEPLGMSASGFEITAVPAARRTHGYRWEENRWKREPDLSAGAFSSIGGLCTSAKDYARWVAFLLSAWAPGDAVADAPVSRASVQELAQGYGPVRLRPRFGGNQAGSPDFATVYGMGFHAGQDRDLGRVLFHGGGYPGYGSHLLLLPDAGVGVFAFANRTYSGPAGPVWDAALVLHRHGALAPKPQPVSPEVAAAYEVVGKVYQAGRVEAAAEAVAMNFFLDRSPEVWDVELARLKAATGECDTASPIRATGVLSGQFEWRGATGRLSGALILSPESPPRIQALKLELLSP
jgi:D-alanyl-D-alanine-carboxypeptidase/D-alanyl-D-alanine-endopeptidase